MNARNVAITGALVASVVWACGELNHTNESCSKGTDCLAPYVCCTNPRIPAEGQSIPFCEDPSECDGYLPFLIEGNPCAREPAPERALPDAGADCAEGLECCATTLVCTKAGTCPTAFPDAGTLPTDAAPPGCNADSDCAPGLVCCGIEFFHDRDGTCVTVQSCNSVNGRGR